MYSLRSAAGIGLHAFKTGAQMIKNPLLNAINGVYEGLGTKLISFASFLTDAVEGVVMLLAPIRF